MHWQYFVWLHTRLKHSMCSLWIYFRRCFIVWQNSPHSLTSRGAGWREQIKGTIFSYMHCILCSHFLFYFYHFISVFFFWFYLYNIFIYDFISVFFFTALYFRVSIFDFFITSVVTEKSEWHSCYFNLVSVEHTTRKQTVRFVTKIKNTSLMNSTSFSSTEFDIALNKYLHCNDDEFQFH